MNWQAVSFDWNLARAFLVTTEQGTLSGAARALGLTQPTIGRQVAALEAQLDIALFDRGGRSLTLTEAGFELLDHVRMMGEAAGRISLTASGQSQTIEGQVCISASDMMAANWLPPVLERIREAAPAIQIEVVASNEISDLRRREADIAIRHVRPDQPDLITRLMRESTAHLYAASSYLERHGRPATPADLVDATFIGYQHSDRLLHRLNRLGLQLDRSNFKLIAQSGIVLWEMVKQGLGISVMMKDIAELTPDVECLLPELEPIPVPIWLTTHRELHTSRRIRLVFDLLADTLTDRNAGTKISANSTPSAQTVID